MLTSHSIQCLLSEHAAMYTGDYFYLLVDHAGLSGLQQLLVKRKLEWVSLFEATKQANAISVAPLLIRIVNHDVKSTTFLSWICERGAYSSCLIFLASPLSIHKLAARLTTRLDARVSENMDVLLRFYDPRIFEQLCRTLSFVELQVFLSVANSWWYINRYGDPYPVTAQFSSEEFFESPLVLSGKQEFELLDSCEPDQVAEHLRQWVPKELELIPVAVRHEFILRHICAGRQIHITSTRELALYCTLALVYGENFASTSNWKAKLGLVKSGNEDLTGLISKLNQYPLE
jgi:hypothetical protein